MQTKNLATWAEFEEEVEGLIAKPSVLASPFLFRGQPNSTWKLETTLERYVLAAMNMGSYYQIVLSTRAQVETITGKSWKDMPASYEEFIKEIKTWGGMPPGVIPAYDYFVYLRHHGFPSPLLDWTNSPFVAAYFAFRDVSSEAKEVAIFAYREYVTGGKSWTTGQPVIKTLGPYVRSHPRHFQQQSRYTICTVLKGDEAFYAPHEEVFATGVATQDTLIKYILPVSERKVALNKLELFNINAFSLFGSEDSLMEALSIREIYSRDH